MTENEFKVPTKQWRRWGPVARGVFNSTYSQVLGIQSNLTHPKQEILPHTQWKTLCWNLAWMAADNVQREFKILVGG